jgi:predicted CopG family antitoxin
VGNLPKKKITISIDEELQARIQQLAIKEKRSFSQQLCKLVEDKLNEITVKAQRGE